MKTLQTRTQNLMDCVIYTKKEGIFILQRIGVGRC